MTTPSDREVLIHDAVPGAYAAVIEPLGEVPTFYSFVVDDRTDTIDTPALSNLYAASVSKDWLDQFSDSAWSKSMGGSAAPGSRTQEMRSASPPVDDDRIAEAGFDDVEDQVDLASPSAHVEKSAVEGEVGSSGREADSLPMAPRRFSIGLSVDTRPMGYGGWRPYEGPWPIVFSTARNRAAPVDGGTKLEEVTSAWLHIDRGHAMLVSGKGDARGMPLPDDGARLRLSVSIEGLRVERTLIPLFTGGVTIEFALDPSGGVLLDVAPVDLEKLSLSRALSSAVGIEGQGIWSDFTRRTPVATYISGDIPEDPWTVILAMLCAVRFPGVEEREALQWAPDLARQFAWIPDSHVLLARSLLIGAAPDDRKVAASEALRALSIARRLGAPYFAYANTLLGDMLTALRDGAPEAEQRDQARKEMGYWSRHLPHQRVAGASFSWVMSSGARSRGGLDERYSSLLALGSVEANSLSITPIAKATG
ncbi:hypothetical protein [Novosphingobium sp.]|uniref:hypothetical protein n=1 Tax=Novosphingobium sp. TaxID=1874826 RepID=UPI002FDE2C04